MSNKPRTPRTLRIRRGESIVGEFSRLQAASLLETGGLLPTDLCYDHTRETWVPLPETLADIKLQSFGQAQPREPSTNRSPSRSQRRTGLAWVVAGVATAAALTAWLWGWNQTMAAAGLRERLLAEREAAHSKAADPSPAPEEIAPLNVLRGQVILRDDKARRSVVPGMKVRLYRRETVEQAVENRYRELRALPSPPPSPAAYFLQGFPEPLAMTATDSNGRFEFTIDEPGDYVVQTSSLDATTRVVNLWLVVADSRDTLNTPLLISENNAARVFSPVLIFTDGR